MCYDILVCYRIEELQLRVCTYLGEAFPENLLQMHCRMQASAQCSYVLYLLIGLGVSLKMIEMGMVQSKMGVASKISH